LARHAGGRLFIIPKPYPAAALLRLLHEVLLAPPLKA
jgi:hypothetical protein